jgi:hypothetical protein
MLGILGVVLASMMVALAFGLAGGAALTETKYRDPLLHQGEWEFKGVQGSLVVWMRKAKRKKCNDDHQAFLCTIARDTSHVDMCECGMTRKGVFGTWC